jgi:hypothetical protein
VNTSNYSTEYGRAAGGVVNAVTKSGTNQFHGQGYYLDRDSQWAAYNDYTKESVQQTPGGPFVSVPFKPTDLRRQYGFGIGGPIIKDSSSSTSPRTVTSMTSRPSASLAIRAPSSPRRVPGCPLDSPARPSPRRTTPITRRTAASASCRQTSGQLLDRSHGLQQRSLGFERDARRGAALRRTDHLLPEG